MWENGLWAPSANKPEERKNPAISGAFVEWAILGSNQ